MDDRTVGLLLRALRRRRGWRQADLAARVGCSQSLVSAVERGHLDQTTILVVRRMLAAVDARVTLDVRWRGAEADRLLDADHASLVETTARRLEAAGWQVLLEVTYAIGGERGSIDIAGVDPVRRAAMVVEVKSDIPVSEAVGRKLDEKGRLAATILRSRLGWAPDVIAVVLVLPDSDRLRRLLAGGAASLARMFPVDSRRVERWLRKPEEALHATWFVSNSSPRNLRARQRVRKEGPQARLPADPPHVSVVSLPDEPPTRILR